MTRTILILCALAACGATSIAAPSVSRKEGKGPSNSEGLFSNGTPIQVKVGDRIEAVCELHLKDFDGEPTIIANPRLANPTGKTIRVRYHVAFFDNEGKLVGCASQGCTLQPGARQVQLASCLVFAPPEDLKKVYSYQIVLYEVEVQENPK